MRLAVRLWLLGAVVPVVCVRMAIAVGGTFFRATLLRALDRALLEQAAVEAVSLFDGPGGTAHLHLASSPLRDTVGAIVPASAIYREDGQPVVRERSGAGENSTDALLVPAELPTAPRLVTRRSGDGRPHRVLSVALRDPKGRPFGLQLVAALTPVDSAVRSFYAVGAGMTLALAVVLVLIQTVLARRLSARVNALTTHMEALREGDLAARPPAADGRDEIAALARVVAEATGRLRQARDAQDRLVADAAHELRTPLTLMRTSIDLALRRRRETPELVEALEVTRREVDRLARLATRLLDLATAGRGSWDRAPGELVAVVEAAAEAIRAEAETKGVLVEVRAEGRVPALFDPNGIRQAVDNLLANAVRFSPPERTVTVRVWREGELARIAVSDEGPGIPEPERERIFQPFEHGKQREAGAGLGLAIVREIARGHGGRAFAGAPARGAEVVLELPVGAAGARAVTA
jgi:signal transduction histidine kinase